MSTNTTTNNNNFNNINNNLPKRQNNIANIINANDNNNNDNNINSPDNKKQKIGLSKNGTIQTTSASSSPSLSQTTIKTTSILERNLSNAINAANLKYKQSVTSNPIGLNHRPVTSCSHCRQHKIKCDANQKYPEPCTRCKKFDLFCEINPKFTPKKGSQLQTMRKDIDELKLKVKHLLANESLLINILKESNINFNNNNNNNNNSINNMALKKWDDIDETLINNSNSNNNEQNKNIEMTNIGQQPISPDQLHFNNTLFDNNVDQTSRSHTQSPIDKLLLKNNDMTNLQNMPLPASAQLQLSKQSSTMAIIDTAPATSVSASMGIPKTTVHSSGTLQNNIELSNKSIETTTISSLESPFVGETGNIKEFILGDVHISIEQASQLHKLFIDEYLPYLSIMFSTSVVELYSQSKLLFWTVILTACLSDPSPALYIKLSPLVKQLAIELCCLCTPRSTHLSQALTILAIWPLPNQKVLDDCSYRFINLAKSLSYQLGLHRGEFIYEFTRNQKLMPNAKKWRTRTWLGIFFTEICWSTILGLPPTSQIDYLVETAKHSEEMDKQEVIDDIMNKIDDDYDNSKPYTFKLPSRFKKLIYLASFQMKLCNVMGSSVESSHGLIDPKGRSGALMVLEKELNDSNKDLGFESDIVVHIYYLYVILNICCFAFLPQTPIKDQSQYITKAYFCATKCITLVSKLVEKKPLITLPIYLRQSITFSGLMLFKLQLNSLIINRYLNSARQSIVTVHRLFRNQSSAWSHVENDITRTATMLEKANMILITHPEVFTEGVGIISRIRSHLTGSLFYDFVWCVHEARRRQMDPNCNTNKREDERYYEKRLYPLPLYNHIQKEDFQTVTETTPNGTTVTTLVPTSNALKIAEQTARGKNGKEHGMMTINGIPLSMLDETGSVKNYHSLFQGTGFDWSYSSWSSPSGTVTPYTITASVNSENINENDMKVTEEVQPSIQYNRSVSSTKQSLNQTKISQSLFHTEKHISSSFDKYTQNPYLNNTNTNTNINTSMSENITLFNNNSNKVEEQVVAEQSNNTNKDDHNTKESNVKDNSNSNINYINKINDSNNNNNKRKRKEKQLNSDEALEATYLNDFFQQQSLGWTEGDLNTDDLFGWYDNVNNVEPEF